MQPSRAIRKVHVRALAGDRLNVQLVLAGPAFLPPINVGVLIERQPSLPDSPVLVLKLAGMGGLTRLAGPVAGFLNVLPQGIRMAGDRVHVDLGAVLQRRGLGLVLQHVEELRLNTDEGTVRVGFRARLRNRE
jgi:hypothetical protein